MKKAIKKVSGEVKDEDIHHPLHSLRQVHQDAEDIEQKNSNLAIHDQIHVLDRETRESKIRFWASFMRL